MKLINSTTKTVLSIHKHADNKQPSYFKDAAVSIAVEVNGIKQKFVLNPNRLSNPARVNFFIEDEEGTKEYLSIDSPKFAADILAMINSKAVSAGVYKIG
jgi:hypothetical protein